MARTMRKGGDASRRRAPRLPVELDGSLSGRQSRPVKVLDLSPLGCLVRCDSTLDPGAILDLDLRLDPETLRAKVRVTNSCLEGASAPGRPHYLAGLEFLSLSAREQAALRRFLEEERRRRRSADTPAI